MRDKSLRLLTLGTAALVDANGAPVVQQRRRIALLVLVALSGSRGIARDKLIAYLSPDSTTDSARHALHQLLYYLRQQAGDEVFVGTDPLRLNTQRVSLDVAEFDEAYASGAFSHAAALYRGPFLDGFYLPESAEFEEWAAAERAQHAARYRDLLKRLTHEARASGDHAAALAWSLALSASDPLSASAALEQMRALAASGDRAGALRKAQAFQERLHIEMGLPKDPEVESYASELRAARLLESSAAAAARATEAERKRSNSDVATAGSAQLNKAEESAGSEAAIARNLVSSLPDATSPLARAGQHRHFRIALGLVMAIALVLALTFAPSPPDVMPRTVATPALQSRLATVRDVQTIAIMPVENAAEDTLQYVASGIEQALLNRLSRVDGVRVISPSVMRQYDARDTTAGVLGRRVDATALLNARIQREHDTLWLTLNVMRSDDGERSGGGRFPLTSPRIVAIESALIDSIAIALGISRIAHGVTGPRDSETYLLVMRASYYMLNRNPASLRRARDLLNEAIERDPTYAEAHAQLSGVYGAFAEYSLMPAEEAHTLSHAAAQTALRLDPTLTVAMATLALERGVRYWRWQDAANELRRAAEMEPWRATTWNLLGTTLRRSGRFDEALEATRRARELEPTSRHYNLQIGHVFRCAGQLDSALIWLQRASTIGAPHPGTHTMLAEVLARLGRHDEALDELGTAAHIARDTTSVRLIQGLRGNDGYRHAVATLARLEIERIRARPSSFVASSTTLAELYARAGDSSQAFAMLERAVDERHPNIGTIGCTIAYKPFRDHPRFVAVMRAVKLSSASYGKD